MNELKQWAIDSYLSRIVGNRIVGVFLVGFLILFTVGCSKAPSNSAVNPSNMSAPTSKMGYPEPRTGPSEKTPQARKDTNVYDYTSPENKANVQSKTRELVDTAKRKANETQSLEDLPDKVRRSAEDVKDNISEGLEDQKEGLAQGTKKGIKNLKKNIDKASEEIPKVVKEATENATSAIK